MGYLWLEKLLFKTLFRFQSTFLKWVLEQSLLMKKFCLGQLSFELYLQHITPQKKSMYNRQHCSKWKSVWMVPRANHQFFSSQFFQFQISPIQLPGLGTTTHSGNCLNYNNGFNLSQDLSHGMLWLRIRQTITNLKRQIFCVCLCDFGLLHLFLKSTIWKEKFTMTF